MSENARERVLVPLGRLGAPRYCHWLKKMSQKAADKSCEKKLEKLAWSDLVAVLSSLYGFWSGPHFLGPWFP